VTGGRLVPLIVEGEKHMNFPNLLSISRISLIPFLVIVYYLPFQHAHFIAALIFLLAGATDWLDGYLARKLDQETPFGAFLDPVADKLVVAAAIILVIGHGNLEGLTLPSIVIIGREIAVSALREWMAELGKSKSVAVSYMGKIKTTLQITSVSLLVWHSPTMSGWLVVIAYILYYVTAGLTLWSMLLYFKAAWPQLRSGSAKIA